MSTPTHGESHGHGTSFMALALGALGVVYGDIGTSPLYALKECFNGHHALPMTQANVLGVLSLVFWSLTSVVTVKYLAFIVRADSQGEGGIFSLLSLAPGEGTVGPRSRAFIVTLAVFAAALLYGDGVITPAISVLSAVEGLSVATDAADRFVVPLTCLILVGLFVVQKNGTSKIGLVFGPVMVLWFSSLAALGIAQIVKNPAVFAALNPAYAVNFFMANGMAGFVVLGSVVLCITGGEALYADMGHFGRKPIQAAWFALVFPALLLNYFGQGALLLATNDPEVHANPFFGMVPKVLLYPMVGLAMSATVIASQALISGAYSMTRQAVQLGFLPRMLIQHTSQTTEGQIYVPLVNTLMAIACVALVLGFKSSSNLAAAYGLAVTMDMIITTVVFFFVVRYTWKWSAWKTFPLIGGFLLFDLAYFGSNALKFMDGGWLPVTIGAVLLLLMLTWRDGRKALSKNFDERNLPFDLFMSSVREQKPHRVPGTAIFMFSSPTGTSPVLLHYYKHNYVLHEQVVMLSVIFERSPFVNSDEAVHIEDLGEGFFRVVIRFGFMQPTNVPSALAQCAHLGLKTEPDKTSFFLGRETLLCGDDDGRNAAKDGAKIPKTKRKRAPGEMMQWRKRLFAAISRNAQPATAYFNLPPGRVVELGMQIDL